MTDKELDIAIAKHVFGANLTPTENISVSTPAFSTTGDGMLSVIEKLAGKFQIRIDGCNVSAHESGLPRGCWGVTIAPWGTDPDDGRGSASPNLPRAVAIAALKALNVEA